MQPGLGALIDQAEIASMLAPWVEDEEDRQFIARCIATEGPLHHRLASFALLRLVSKALTAAGGAAPVDRDDGVSVPFRLPPHLDRRADEEAHYPIRLPRRAIDRLAASGSRESTAFSDALADGPAHHALANVAIVCMVDALLDRIANKDGE